jgi:recombinational DNA repair ATPase RecF
MKIESLTVTKFRGLIDFAFECKSDSVVISGPNGSGKSAVVDALDFLFTGTISRLRGKGTGQLSLEAHGPHIDHHASDAVVSASVVVDGSRFQLERAVSNSSHLQITPEPTAALTTALSVAERGYHVLSRRELLEYIAAEPSKRAQQVQALLRLDRIEELRKLLTGAARDLQRTEKDGASNLAALELDVATILGLASFDDASVLQRVNALRAELEGPPLLMSGLSSPKTGLTTPTAPPTAALGSAAVRLDLSKLVLDDATLHRIGVAAEELRALAETTESSPELTRDLQHKQLIDLGIKLAADSTECPLCGRPWDARLLREHLEGRAARANAAAKLQKEAAVHTRTVISTLQHLSVVLPRLIEAAASLGNPTTHALFSRRLDDWNRLLATLNSPFPFKVDPANISTLCSWPADRGVLGELEGSLSENALPASASQSRWDTLTRFEQSWKNLERAKARLGLLALKRKRCVALVNAFETARDVALGGLYGDIEARFVAYYKTLHANESPTFAASLKPEKAGLSFEVDFFGRGKFPPVALHSEGHQDSMGLCLYLALMEKLTFSKVRFTVLDDVVMSVDAGHRRAVCELLRIAFSGRQFFITTHDKAWARQLRSTAVVPSRNFLAFRDWTVDAGPLWREEDAWKDVTEFCNSNQTPRSAAALRRELEELFDEACDNLSAPVPYSGEGKYDLGELASAAISTLGKHLSAAKAAAASWGHQEKILELDTLLANFASAKTQTSIDQWIINQTLHFNRWLQATPGDFRPIIAAFSALRKCFLCAHCETLLHLVRNGSGDSFLQCSCGSSSWTLTKRRSQKK